MISPARVFATFNPVVPYTVIIAVARHHAPEPLHPLAPTYKLSDGMLHTFTFIAYDEGGVKVGPDGDHRLVCVAESGAKVAMFGSNGNLANINSVIAAGLPCNVRCKTRSPATYASERFGHTHWVSEDSALDARRSGSTSLDDSC